MGRPKGIPASPAQRAAGRANLAKGRAAREQAIVEQPTPAGERWAQLLDGTLTVRDLTDAEIKKGKVKGRGGSYSRRAMPSHLVKAFSDERLRRANEGLARLLPIAVQTYAELMVDPEASAADRQRIAKDVIERNLGKTPDRVQWEGDNPWSAALREVLVDRDLADFAGDGIDVDADA